MFAFHFESLKGITYKQVSVPSSHINKLCFAAHCCIFSIWMHSSCLNFGLRVLEEDAEKILDVESGVKLPIYFMDPSVSLSGR